MNSLLDTLNLRHMQNIQVKIDNWLYKSSAQGRELSWNDKSGNDKYRNNSWYQRSGWY